ncbi:MAG: leucyl aminopeptidase [Myxococcales bacterium]
MKVDLAAATPLEQRVDLLGVPCFEEDFARGAKGPVRALLASADRALSGQLLEAAREERFEGGAEATFVLHAGGRLRSTRLALLGLGPRARYQTEQLRQAAAQLVRAAGRVSAERAALLLPGAAGVAPEARAAAEGALLGGYRFDRYRSSKAGQGRAPLRLTLLAPRRGAEARRAAAAIGEAASLAAAVAWARDLVNEPAGVLTPRKLADEAARMARACSLRCEVRGPAEIRRLRMGMFLGVAQGSAEEPRLIHLAFEPRGAAARRAPLCIVGKAITFDSGGLSLKTNEGMLDMKTDMAGAAAALGAMRAIAELRPPFPVHAFMGACENMPGGRAYKLGDVLVSRAGKTVEITNTDAEGRLVLGDVLAWAADWKPAALVDLATLTGACMVALGMGTAGLFSSDDPLADELLAAARAAGEDVWRLPLSEPLRKGLESDVADMKNTGERWGGAITAALFLREFAGKAPWAHLDIAGPSFSHRERGYTPKGGTGAGVRTLVEWVRRRAAAT